MPTQYFSNFPVIVYENKPVRNITLRASVLKDVKENGTLFYDYVLREDDKKPYTLAEDYYGNPYLDWLIFYSNDIVDPFYDWYLDTNEFYKFIFKKYETIDKADLQISHFENQVNTDIIIGKSSVYCELTYSNTSNSFVVGETITQIQSGISKTGIVVSSNSTVVTLSDFSYVFNTSNTCSSNTSLNTHIVVSDVTFILANTDVAASITTEDNITVEGISPSVVTMYEQESRLNELRKFKRLINSDLSSQAVEDLERLLS